MTADQKEWALSRDELIHSLVELGFPKELGNEIARTLGSLKAMRRMNSYLYNVKPQSAELIVDEMLAIRSEMDAWREKKTSEEANARYNNMLYYGFPE